jgi:hypothetical protein
VHWDRSIGRYAQGLRIARQTRGAFCERIVEVCAPLRVPGIGAQGATIGDVRREVERPIAKLRGVG